MSSKAKGDDGQNPKTLKLGRKDLTKRINEINSQLQELEKEYVSFHDH